MFQESVSEEFSYLPGVLWKESGAFTHKCNLKFVSFGDLFHNRSRYLRNTSVSESNPLTKNYFTSIFMIEQEIKRHINGPYWYIIHPLSNFALMWERIMLIVHIVNWYIVLFQIANYGHLTSTSGIINFVIQCPCYMDIVLRFYTGIKNDYEIFLNQRTIVMNYLKTWFFSDFITSIPFQVVDGMLTTCRLNKLTLNIVIVYQALKILTFTRIRRYFKNSFSIWKRYYTLYLVLALTLYSLLCFHVAVCFYQTGANLIELIAPNNNTHPLNKIHNAEQLPNVNFFWYRNLYCVYLVAIKFYSFSTVYGMFEDSNTFLEIAFILVIILGAFIYHLYLMVKVIQIFQYRHNSKIKYQEIMNQLEEYMRIKRLPLKIKKSLIEFYQQRYQYRFFKEKVINNDLSEPLRRELTFHCGQLFISRIEIFDNTPRKVISDIVACLKPEIYMPNDLIIKSGMAGDCMYFIASGTVAIHATTGHELIHLEDGDHFGEMSLFSKHGRRIANAIAIEYCELYRLDRSDYDAIIAIIPELSDKFKNLAMQRITAIVSIEEVLKTEQSKKYESVPEDDGRSLGELFSSTSSIHSRMN